MIRKMKHILEQTLFLAKQLDDFEGFLTPGKDYSIVACRASEDLLTKYPDVLVYEVIHGKRTYSTQSLFREMFRNYDTYFGNNQYKYIWTYQAYPWTNDFEYAGIKMFCIDYLMFLQLQNKLNQRKILLQQASLQGSKTVKLHKSLLHTSSTLKTIICPRYHYSFEQLVQKYDGQFVICDSYSDGGEGVFKISTKNEFIGALQQIKSPIIRMESFIENCVPANQIGFITSKGHIIKYKPSIQIIQSIHQSNKLEYAGCDFNSELHLPNGKSSIEYLSSITHQVGLALYTIGYRGVFGCDYIVDRKDVHFIEINPRYQASTQIATRSNGNDPILAPHILHILGFSEIPKEYLATLSDFDHESTYVDLHEGSNVRGFLKVFRGAVEGLQKPKPGIQIEDGLEKGYVLFGDSIICSPSYPAQLHRPYTAT